MMLHLLSLKQKLRKNYLYNSQGFQLIIAKEKIDEILGELKPNRSRVILSNGQIIKVSRDKTELKKDIVTKSWKDWIDYWQ